MHPELDRPARVLAAKAKVTDRLVHQCGHCKTCHYVEGEGIRALTPAELFDLHMVVPEMMAAAERDVYPPSKTPAGTLRLGSR
jgi:hypothetical protein